MVLNTPANEDTDDLRKTVETPLCTVAKVRAHFQEVLIDIKDIDEVATKGGVYEKRS